MRSIKIMLTSGLLAAALIAGPAYGAVINNSATDVNKDQKKVETQESKTFKSTETKKMDSLDKNVDKSAPAFKSDSLNRTDSLDKNAKGSVDDSSPF